MVPIDNVFSEIISLSQEPGWQVNNSNSLWVVHAVVCAKGLKEKKLYVYTPAFVYSTFRMHAYILCEY